MMQNKISVIGLGKLGLCYAACFASAGFRVIGIDLNKEAVDAVNRKQPHIFEPDLNELLQENPIEATTDFARAKETDVTFFIVPTPSMADGNFDNKYLKSAFESILPHVKDKYHIFSIVSTVTPSSLENEILPIIKRITGKDTGNFGLCYNPSFIALGDVIRNIFYPDMILIGESDTKAGNILEEIHKKVYKNNAPIMRTNIINAEIAKIALNAYITMKINFGNLIGEICEKVKGGNADEVARIIGTDSRIGRKYLSAGTAYGGPCFPRDAIAFDSFAKKHGVDAKNVRATHEMNEYQATRIAELAIKELGNLQGKTIAILGVSYKPKTNVTEESASIKLAEELINAGAIVKLHDLSPINLNLNGATLHKDIGEALADSELAVIALPSEEYKSLNSEIFLKNMKVARVLDCWRIRQDLKDHKEIKYSAVGINNNIS